MTDFAAQDNSSLPPELKNAIKIAHEQLDPGQGISHEEIMKEIDAKFLKREEKSPNL